MIKKTVKIPENIQNLLLQGKKEGRVFINELMALLPKAEDDIEMIDKVYSELLTQDIELVEDKYSGTWALLEAYDRGTIEIDKTIKNTIQLDTEWMGMKLEHSIRIFRETRINKGEASEIFGQEKEAGSIESIIRDIFQTWDKEDLYPSIEEKAAHLLYFMIKNHPFVDGNKRCGAFAFIFFLQQTKIFDLSRINYQTLSVVALLIAESDPKNKNLMIQVIIHTVLTLLLKI